MANIFPNITSVQALDNVTRCTAQSSVPSSHLSSHNFKGVFFCSDIDHNDNYNHDPYSDMPRLSLVDKARVIGQIQAAMVYEQVDGRVRVGSRPGERFAWPACSPGLNPIGQLWDQLGRAVRTRVTIATMQDIRQIVEDEWNAIPQQRCSAAHIQYEAAVRGCCCGIWWFHPMLML